MLPVHLVRMSFYGITEEGVVKEHEKGRGEVNGRTTIPIKFNSNKVFSFQSCSISSCFFCGVALSMLCVGP